MFILIPSLSPLLVPKDPLLILFSFSVFLGAKEEPLGFVKRNNGYDSPRTTQHEQVTFMRFKKHQLLWEVGANWWGHKWVSLLSFLTISTYSFSLNFLHDLFQFYLLALFFVCEMWFMSLDNNLCLNVHFVTLDWLFNVQQLSSPLSPSLPISQWSTSLRFFVIGLTNK